jgi:MoaA/NifB/PqqE/SkfB family radical SAM enzyme
MQSCEPSQIEITQQRADVKVGFSCNNRCTFCVQGDKRFEYGDKSTEELLETISDARTWADSIVLTGGEVTIRKDLPDLVRHARDLGFKVIQIQTNGRMMAVERALDRLIEAGATEFAPAVHGHNAEIHDALTRAPGAFKQTVKGIINAKKRGMPVIMNSVITTTNAPHLAAMARLFVALRVDQFQLAFCHGVGSAAVEYSSVVARFSDIQDQVIEALRIGIDAGIPCMTEAIPLCFLPGYEEYAAEWIIPRTRIFDASWVIMDYTEERWTAGKIRGPACSGCKWERLCEGPWRDYPDNYGWDEFAPVPVD